MNMLFPTEFDRTSARLTQREQGTKGSSDRREAKPAFAEQLSRCCRDKTDTPKAKPETEAKPETDSKNKPTPEDSQAAESSSPEEFPEKGEKSAQESESKSGTEKATHEEMASSPTVLNFPLHLLALAAKGENASVNSEKEAGEKGSSKGQTRADTGKSVSPNMANTANFASSKGESSPHPAVAKETSSEKINAANQRTALPSSGEKPAENSLNRLIANKNAEAENTRLKDLKLPVQDPKPARTPSSPTLATQARIAASLANERMAAAPPVSLATPSATLNPAPLNMASIEMENARNNNQTTIPGSSNWGQSSGEGDRHRGDANQSSLLNSASGRADAAATQKAENVRIFIGQLDSALQTMRQEKSSNIRLRVSLERGEVIRIHLNLRGGKLKTTIQAENDQVRQLLRSSWSEVSRALSAKGVDADPPEFEDESNSTSQEEKSFQERTEAELARLQAKGEATEDTPDALTEINEPRDSRIFSRIA